MALRAYSERLAGKAYGGKAGGGAAGNVARTPAGNLAGGRCGDEKGRSLLEALVAFSTSLVPGLLWVWHFYRQDREREPVRLVLWAFFAGMAAVVPAALVELPFRDIFGASPDPGRLVVAAAVVGMAEEGAKLLAVYLTAFRRPEFDQVEDGIVYGVAGSLGFAALENLLYATAFGLSVAPVRAVVTSLAHASFGGIAGLYLGLAKARPEAGFALAARGFALASGLHALYDFLLLGRVVHPLLAVGVVILAYRFVVMKLRGLGEGGASLS